MSIRPHVIAGNWKMYKTVEEARTFVASLTPMILNSQATVYLAVPFTAIFPVVQKVKELKAPLRIGAQNMNDASEGAFTGEIAAKMLLDAGATFVILGHSERRALFHETDQFINQKVKRALAEGLQPLVCVGETLAQREKGEIEATLREQLEHSLEGLSSEDLSKIILAYEPVWAIGTGKVAHPQEAQAAHLFCRQVISEMGGSDIAEKLTIQYGGSVKPDNAAELLECPDIDGLLVGGASLSPTAFSEIINACHSKPIQGISS